MKFTIVGYVVLVRHIKAIKTIRLLNFYDIKKTQFYDSTEGESITRIESGKISVLKDINICVETGKVTAIIGKSGCGKSSLMKLFLALYEPNCGNICFSGNELVTFKNLRSKTAYVPQEPMLFSGSVFENICCGYDTMIFEEGKNFSGGEKQRITIARAFFKYMTIKFIYINNSKIFLITLCF